MKSHPIRKQNCISSARALAIVTIAAFLGHFQAVRADVLLSWDFAGNTGSETTVTAGTIASGLAVGSGILSRGAGLTASANADRFNATNWATGSIANAVAGNDYFEFSLNYNSLNSITIDTIVFNWQRSATGNTGIEIRSSLDSYVGSLGTFSVVDNTSVQSFTTLDLGSSFENLTTNITFRIYSFAEAGGGTGGFEGTGADLVVNGILGAAASSSLYWLGADTTRGGAGTWENTGGTAWSSTDADGTGTAWDSSKTAVFNTSPAAVSLSGTVNVAKGISFATGTNGSTISGGTALNLAGATASDNTLTTAAGVTATISSDITGAANGLTKAGDGTLVLGGTNSFVGNVTISGGVLSIGSDAQLGATSNDIILGGTLRTTSSLALNAGRDLSGAGTLDIAPSTTLTVNGNLSTTSLAFSNSGIADLLGTNSVGALSISGNATLQGTAISLTGLTSSHTGTASIDNALNFSSGDKTISVSPGATLSLTGVQTAAGRIVKVGSGTLEVTEDNSTLASSFRLGVAGSTPTDGGTLKIGHQNSLGASGASFQFNYGTLEATTALTGTSAIPHVLSIGGRTGAAATISGSNTEFSGDFGFFRQTGTSGQMVLNVNNNTILSGDVQTIGGGGTATGLTLGGTGTLTLSGVWTNNALPITVADSLTLIVNTTLATAFTVDANSTLSGTGNYTGGTTIFGEHSPGMSPGIDSHANLTYNGANILWELIGNTTSGRGTNFDGINVSGTLDFASATTLTLDFNLTGSTVDWADLAFWSSNPTWLLFDLGGDSSYSNLTNLSVVGSNWFDGNDVNEFDDFWAGSFFEVTDIGGDLYLRFNAIPEPSRLLLVGLGALGLVFRRRRA